MDPLFEATLNAAALRPNPAQAAQVVEYQSLVSASLRPATPEFALQAVVAAYDKAKLDEETKLPTYLMLALEMARKSC